MKHCSAIIVYNEVHCHIPSIVIFLNGKIIEQTWQIHRAETDPGKGIYNRESR